MTEAPIVEVTLARHVPDPEGKRKAIDVALARTLPRLPGAWRIQIDVQKEDWLIQVTSATGAMWSASFGGPAPEETALLAEMVADRVGAACRRWMRRRQGPLPA